MATELYDLVTIGAGAGISAFIRAYLGENSSRSLRLPHRVGLVEPRARPGVGSAWDESHPHLITNMHSHTLAYYGALSSDGDFELQTPRSLIPEEERAHDVGQPYLERAKVGHRLYQLFEETLGCAYLQGVSIEHVRASATRLRRAGTHFVIELDSGKRIRARCVVLALGILAIDRHPQFTALPRYHVEGWNLGGLLSRIDPASRVAILGAGPTAIDWFLRLAALDLRAPVVMASRSGRLPAVRPILRPLTAPSAFDRDYLRRKSDEKPFTAREVELIMRAILTEAGTTPYDLELRKRLARSGGRALFETTLAMSEEHQPFFEGLKRVDEVTTTLWCRLSDEGRARIVSKWAPLHAALSFAIPPGTASIVQAALDTGHLELHGGLTDVAFREGGFRLFFAAEGEGQRTEKADVLINATGFQGDLADCTSSFVRQLLADGLVVKGQFGGIVMEYDTGQVLTAQGDPSKGLYAFGGTLSRTAAYSINSLLGTTQHAILVGMACARYLQLQDFIDDRSAEVAAHGP